MARMKKIFLYLMMLVGFFIYSVVMSKLAINSLSKQITNIEILTEIPIIAVDNCKVGKFNGHINGTVRNNTGKHIEKAFLKIDLYDESNKYIGTEYEELKYFNVNEILKFDTTFEFEDVMALKLSVVYEEDQVEQLSSQNDDWSLNGIMTEENIDLALPIAAGLILFIIF